MQEYSRKIVSDYVCRWISPAQAKGGRNMANREYKSDVFSMLLEDRARALDVYNAMAGTAYTDPEIIEIHMLESGVSLTVHNDASFVVSMDSVLNIYEHQSTYNPNMPLRELIYFVTIIKKLVENKYLLSHKLVKIPTPKFAVFYNGDKTRPEREVLKLSDAYENQSDEPQLELMCTVYNINPGNNEDLKMRSQTLREYMIFVGYVNENLAKAEKGEKDYETAIRDAVNRCIAENILKNFLLERGEDVQKSMMFDLTYEKQMENAKREWYNDGVEEGRAEGYSSGIAEGRASGIAEGTVRHLVTSVVKKVQKNKTLDQIADELEESVEDIQPIYDIVKKHAPEYDVDAITTEVMVQENME